MKSSKMNWSTRDRASRFTVGGPFARSLRIATSTALMGLAFLSASSSALAGVPGLDLTVTSQAPLDSVTNTRPIAYSVTGTTYQAAYTVRMTATSPTNTVYFYAFTAATNGLTPQFTPTVADLRPGDSCQAPAVVPAGTELDCVIGPIAQGSTVTFTLLIPSPLAPPPDVTGKVPNSLLSVTWAVQSGQGQPNPSNLIHQGTQDVTLHVGSAKDGVQSYVLANDTLSVEDSGAETKVKTPKPVTVGLKQVVPGSSCSPQNKKCFESTVTIVDTSTGVPKEVEFTQADPLQVDLFRPVSSLKKGAKFANANLLYKSGGGAWVPIPTCALAVVPPSPTQPYAIPTSYPFRCITPQVLPIATNGQTGVDALGNWYFHILGLFNGTTDW